MFFAIIFSIFAAIGVYTLVRFSYYEIQFKNRTHEPKIFLATIEKHRRFSSDKKVAESILDSYMRVRDYRNLLVSHSKYTGNDYDKAVKTLESVLHKHKALARKYLKSNAYLEDRQRAKNILLDLGSEVNQVEVSTDTSLSILKKGRDSKNSSTQSYLDSVDIHQENIKKCDTIRLYNHKAKPLKDLSTSLINILENLKNKPNMEKQREEVLNQLIELSKVIDASVEALPTYDSKAYVNNKLEIHRNLLKELDKADYIDLLRIENNKD